MLPAVSIVENLRRSAATFPDKAALIASEQSISYAQLWRRSQAVTAYLQADGLAVGERVAIVMENSHDYVAIYYGVLAAGGIAVTLAAAAKQRDFAHWLSHCDPRYVFGAAANVELGAAMAASRAPSRLIDAGDGEILGGIYDFVQPLASGVPLAAAMPASILYTSGTTAAPKGVLLSHGNLANNTASIVDYLGLRPSDSIVSVLPFYYSYGNSVLHTHIAVGATVILQTNLVYPHLVVEELARRRVTGFAGVPSTYALLLARVELSKYDLSALRYMTQAGGAMAPAMIRRLRAAVPKAELFVMYGQTEATARLSFLPPRQLETKLGSVGVSIPGVDLQVRLDDGTLAQVREVGEVWARGPNVMLGYWRNDAATAATVRDGWLRTGDLGYMDEDDYLFLSGRRSDMIKTGAHRVHPQDVEEAILELSGVAEAAVVAIPDETLGEAIKAFVVLAEGATIDEQVIKRHCRASLANHKVPKHVELRDHLPKTASGKVLRRQLLEPSQST